MASKEIDIGEVISDWLSRRGRDLRDHFEEYDIDKAKIAHSIALGTIIMMAAIIRLFPLILGWDPLIKAFDPWMQLRGAQYILDKGFLEFLVWWDPYSWYPFGRLTGASLYIGVPLTIIFVYSLLTFLGFNVSLQLAAYLVPIIFGTLGVYAIYLLGKELISARGGLFAALIMSVSPSFVSRTIGGFVDNESVGVLFMVMTLYFFSRAFLRDSNRSAIAAGISMFMLGSSWGAFRFTYDLFPVIALVMIITGKFSTRFLKTYVTTISISTILMMMVPRVGGKFLGETEGIAPVGFIAFMVLFVMLRDLSANLSPESFRKIILLGFTILLILVGGTFIILLSTGLINKIGDKFISVLLPGTRNKLPLIDSVSEHLPLAWGGLYANLSTLVFLMPLGVYFALKQPTEKNVFLLTFGLTSILISGSMIRLLLILAPAAAILSALAIDNLLIPYAYAAHGRIKLTKITMSLPSIGGQNAAASYFVVFILLLIVVSGGVNSAANRFSSPEITPGNNPNEAFRDWLEAFDWMKEHSSYRSYVDSDGFASLETGQPPVMASWWDYGYYITAQGETISLVDNATFNSTQIGILGTMMMWNETSAINLMYMYNVKYVLVVPAGGVLGLGSDIGKSIWMIRISERYTKQFGVVEEDYFDDQGGGYQNKYFDSVLWKLMAYRAPDMGEDPGGTGRPPFTSQGGSQLENLVPAFRGNPVEKEDLLYFSEVFRSTGVIKEFPGLYPYIRIFEVEYPDDIAQRVVEFKEVMAKIYVDLANSADDE